MPLLHGRMPGGVTAVLDGKIRMHPKVGDVRVRL
jgi:hypothetical protein